MSQRRPPVTAAAAEQGRHWGLFADWCAARGQASLPASPSTVAAFLAELPAGPVTLARRVRAIDAVHAGAGLPRPGDTRELDEILGRRPGRPRFEPDLVARALEAIPVGGWPVGIVGRRDAAIVALICVAGLTRAQVQALHTGASGDLPLGSLSAPQHAAPQGEDTALLGQRREEGGPARRLLETTPRAEAPGACPACALSRWLRVAHRLEQVGWRAVRVGLADYGEVPAGEVAVHDCAQPVAWPTTARSGGAPLFCAIDGHGAPETGWAISTRSITTIVAERLAFAEGTDPEPAAMPGPVRPSSPPEGVSDHDWGVAQRRAADERFAQMEATLDEAEEHAEALLARVHAAMGEESQSSQAGEAVKVERLDQLGIIRAER